MESEKDNRNLAETRDVLDMTAVEEEEKRKMQETAKKTLNLPEDLRVEKKVSNALYDIYYVPGYDKYKLGQVPDFAEDDKKKQKNNRLRTLAEKNINGVSSLPCINTNSNKQPNLNTDIGPNVGIQINTSGVHPAKRVSGNRTGNYCANNENGKLKDGTEFWQTTFQNNFEPWGDVSKAKANQPEWTFHRPPYNTQYKLGASEYRYSFGE